jgi:sarcosine oxidase subunit gamma
MIRMGSACVVERLSAVASAYRAGTFGAVETSGPGLVIAERRPLQIVQIAAQRGVEEVVRGAVVEALGVIAPAEPNTVTSGEGETLLWIGPRRWLVVAAEEGGRDLMQALRGALSPAEAAVTELGNGRTVWRLSGRNARDVLSKGTSIDLHKRAFPPGRCAQALLGHASALIHAVDAAPTFDLYVARSFALTVWEWLTEAAAEYGYQVTGAVR